MGAAFAEGIDLPFVQTVLSGSQSMRAHKKVEIVRYRGDSIGV
jgi:hypothetical protein